MGKIEDIRELVEIFRLERMIYITLTSLSAVTLMGVGLYLAIVQNDYTSFLALFVPTGTLTFCIYRLLKMWDDAIKFLSGHDQR